MQVCLAFAVFISVALSTVSGQCFGENDDAPEAVPTDVKSLSDGSTDFALALFKGVLPSNAGPDANIFISPISVWSALTLTYLGTRGQSKTQMEKELGLRSTNQKRVNDLYQDLKDGLLHNATKKANYTFNMANKVYFDEKFQILKCMIDNLDTEVEKVDFVKAPEVSRDTINKWVENQTNNKIVELIPKSYIDSDTVMVLVNAAYFKAYWEIQFPESATKDQDFFIEPDRKVKVKMMQLNKKTFPFLKTSPLGFSAIELPYSDFDVGMTILLPDQGTKVEELVPKLTPGTVKTLYDTMKRVAVNLSLPKFKIEQSMELKENLIGLGITDIFDIVAADLSGFTGKRDSYVEHVRHKTFIEVNEGGTEAAAATAVVSATRLSAIEPQHVEEFIVNRPFILLMRNIKYNIILFAGIVRNPTK